MTESNQQPFAQLLSEMLAWSPRLLALCLVLVLLGVLIRITSRVIPEIAEQFSLDPHLTLLLTRTIRITLIVIGTITALGTVGINVAALVTGLGLTGFALGFALKDTISNLLAGILILLYQPFRIGDLIKVSGYKGEVSTIDLRYTELSQGGHTILIPNSRLFTDPIVVLKPPQ